MNTPAFDNNRTRKSINNIDKLLPVCLCEADDPNSWSTCIADYRAGFKILRQPDDYTDDDVKMFQRKMDDFFQSWIKIGNGAEGITNYIHMLSSGHIAEYMFHWRNLYMHSQQGWEALNALLKVFYFRRTMRGGGKCNKSRLVPIAEWFARRMVWFAGYEYDYMVEYLKERQLYPL